MTWANVAGVAGLLAEHHYLGAAKRGVAWADEHGVIVIAKPTSRRLPGTWFELSRWCIIDRSKNAGSRQWGAFIRAFRLMFPDVTTLISYSDPSVGHTGALYRACNWWWAPTWHRLRPPPTGNGSWREDRAESVKDRWIFAVRADPSRVELLLAQDDGLLRRFPFARYAEPGGADYRQFMGGTK